MAKPWPYTTVEQLNEAGYHLVRELRCRGKGAGGSCDLLLHFYSTPEGKEIPLNPQTLMPHHSTCPDVLLFRKGKKK